MWFQLGNIVLGFWLLLAPAVLPSTGPGATVDRIAGPLIIWIGVLALRDVTRPFRLLNVLSGLFLIIAPWLVPSTPALLTSSVLTGCAIIVLAIPRGRVRQRTDGGWRAIVQPDLLTRQQD
jgi:hypothetical protein